ncbi:M50 family metallopeptidase [Paenibacillus sp. CC-CFT747]|nr:M50 family metallopeptidase [Paenibacillus sp. CC-CFT747]
MIHEFGHAMVTLMLSGTVMNIDLYADHSGVTRSLVSNRAAMIPIGLSGYVTASLFAWGLFSLYARRRQTLGLLLIMGVAVGSLLLFVRNGFGMAWLAGFIVLTAVVLLLAPKTVVKYYYLFIAFLTLEESVTGSVTILLAAYLHPGRAGDASVLANVSPVPAIVWGPGSSCSPFGAPSRR